MGSLRTSIGSGLTELYNQAIEYLTRHQHAISRHVTKPGIIRSLHRSRHPFADCPGSAVLEYLRGIRMPATLKRRSTVI